MDWILKVFWVRSKFRVRVYTVVNSAVYTYKQFSVLTNQIRNNETTN